MALPLRALRQENSRHVDPLRTTRSQQTRRRDAHHRQPPRIADRAARRGTSASRPPAPAAAAVPPTELEDWPRAYLTASGAALTIYQPQVASWADQKHAVLYAAVSHTAKGAKTPAIGTIKVESDTSVALDERLVSFSEFKITESSFPTLQRDQLQIPRRGDRGFGAARGACDRARSRAGERRHEPDRPEERGRLEGGSAADLLQ